MRRYGAFEVTAQPSAKYLEEVPQAERDDLNVQDGIAYSRSAKQRPAASDIWTKSGRVKIEEKILRGWPTPSGKLEFYSTTLRDWGWPEYALPSYIKSHVHPDNLREGEMCLLPNFRLPVQIHTRSANSKWLDEIAHTNPLWIHIRSS
ncbi:MAG: hypothetical protein R2865_08385 [Deinococcales bacterium]